MSNEHHECRRLFFAAMRHPEMRVLRAALLDLKWDKGIDWRTITRIDINPPSPPYSSTWTATTNQHLIVCYWPDDERLDFSAYRLHDENDSRCTCDMCQVVRGEIA